MHPFYFGTSDQPLFGVYHPPHREADRHAGVVMCYPFGQEYMRGHRAFRQLALLLSRAGFHVLRFDYYGTGDSGGDGADARLLQWLQDIHAAVDELRAMAGLDEVALVGTRLGAALAAEAATTRTDISRLVLWDPVVGGEEYLIEMIDDLGPEAGAAAHDATGAAMGFPVPREMRDAVRGLDVTSLAPQQATRIVVSSEKPAYARLGAAWSHAEFRVVPSKGNWNEVDNFGSALVPQEIIGDIVAWLSDRTAETVR